MGFNNPPGAPERNFNILKWLGFLYRRLTDKLPLLPADFTIPNDLALQKLNECKHKNTLTWIGHNTFLIRLGGKVIITDPFFSDYASPFYGFGLKRYVPPAFSIQQLPPIDIIIVSHDHFDHLDLRALESFPQKELISVVVPLKMGSFFHKLGYKIIYELDWHDSKTLGDITICALPAYHYSKRSLFMRNTRLWASFLISNPNTKLFFDGNTAYGPIFLDMGRDYGPIDYALMSIGAYEPYDLMKESHVTLNLL